MGLIRYLLESDSRKSLKKLDKLATKIESLDSTYSAMTDEDLKNQTTIFKERLKNGETTDDILCEAFAVVREAAYRVLNTKHYHVQLMGGICLYQGRIAEMKTGEGKTQTALLPAYLNALTGKGVHVVTVNDYLAKRDAEWMGKVHRFLGLTVGVVVPGMDDDEKRKAYLCDITYATNNELGFDYLRDNLKGDVSRMVQRELNYAIVDEVDSILVDEARTPLIISGAGDESSELYAKVDRFVRTLKGGYEDELESNLASDKATARFQKKIKTKQVESEYRDEENEDKETETETEEKISSADWDFIINRKEKSVTITENGATKAEAYFNIANLADIDNAPLNHHIQQALKAHKLFFNGDQYIVQDNEVLIVDEFTGRLMIGRRYSDGLHQAIEAKEGMKVKNENKTYATITFQNYFRLYKRLSGMTGTAKTEETEFREIYSLDVLEIPTNKKVARVDMNDRIYSNQEAKKRAIIEEIIERNKKGQPVLVGTVTVEKSEEIAKALRKTGIKYNLLNAKNHAREAEIVAQAGRVGAVTIATNMAGRGTDILLGGNPEYLAKKRLREENVDEELIEKATSYAELDEEAEKVRQRYKKLYAEFKVGTDAEKAEVIKTGGLCIIGTERHESRRIDNQLRGRAGRQGDVGVSIFFISIKDDILMRFGNSLIQRIFTDEGYCLESKMLTKSIENAQRAIEGRNYAIRRNVIKYDDVMNKQREVIYGQRLAVLKGEDVHEQVLKYIPDYVNTVLAETVNLEDLPENWDVDYLNKVLQSRLLPENIIFATHDELAKMEAGEVIQKLTDLVTQTYEQKIVDVKERFGIDYHALERRILLMTVDRNWIDHIDAMDQLRKGIVLRGYANADPVVAYKQEGLDMFDEMTERIQSSTVAALLKLKIEINKPVEQPKQVAPKNLVTNSGEGNAPIKKTDKQVGRNDACPCGSGKKYKNCCGKDA